MRLAFFNHSHILGSGIDHVTHHLAEELGKRHEVTVLTYNAELSSPCYKVKLLPMPFKTSRVMAGVLAPLYLPATIEARHLLSQYDTVITQLYPANVIPTGLKTKHIYVEWGVQTSSLFANPMEKAYIYGLDRMNDFAVRHADLVIAPSIEVWDRITNRMGIDALNLNLYGIDLNYFNRNVSPKPVYEEYPDLEGNKVILFAGRVSPHKNIHLLIKAFYLVKKSLHDTKLLLVGRPSFPAYFKELQELIKALKLEDDVILAGLVSREMLPACYAAASVFCVCSPWEGLLIPEPMGMALPMVAYDTPTHRQTVEHGQTGLLVNELKPEALASALIGILSDDKLRHDMGERAYGIARKKFDYQEIAANLEAYV